MFQTEVVGTLGGGQHFLIMQIENLIQSALCFLVYNSNLWETWLRLWHPSTLPNEVNCTARCWARLCRRATFLVIGMITEPSEVFRMRFSSGTKPGNSGFALAPCEDVTGLKVSFVKRDWVSMSLSSKIIWRLRRLFVALSSYICTFILEWDYPLALLSGSGSWSGITNKDCCWRPKHKTKLAVQHLH